MKDIDNICKIALVQAEPVIFDKSASLKRYFDILMRPQLKSRT